MYWQTVNCTGSRVAQMSRPSLQVWPMALTALVDSAYDDIFVPVLGFVFLPWTTIMYLLAHDGQNVSSTLSSASSKLLPTAISPNAPMEVFASSRPPPWVCLTVKQSPAALSSEMLAGVAQSAAESARSPSTALMTNTVTMTTPPTNASPLGRSPSHHQTHSGPRTVSSDMARPFIREPDLANKLSAGRNGTVECVSCNMCLAHDGFDPLRCWRTSPAAVAAHVYTHYVRDRIARPFGAA